jgi:hypothetical protein
MDLLINLILLALAIYDRIERKMDKRRAKRRPLVASKKKLVK